MSRRSKPVPLTPAVVLRLEGLFSGEERDEAEQRLVHECGGGLPFHAETTPELLDRVRIAALKVSGGSLPALCEAIELAQMDVRDLLVTAGFGDDPEAHLSWMPAAPSREPGG